MHIRDAERTKERPSRIPRCNAMLTQLGGGAVISLLNFGIGLLLVGWSVAVIFEVIAMAEVKFPRLPRRKR